MDKEIDRQTFKQVDMFTKGTQKDRHVDTIHTGRKGRHVDRKTGRQVNRKTGRHEEKQKDNSGRKVDR